MIQTVTQSGFNKGDIVIKARSVYPTRALVIDGRDTQGRLLAHPLGGGPQYIVGSKGESELRLVPADEQKQPLWRRTRFSLDGLDGSFEGWTNGELWNGWDRPFFESEEAQRLISQLTDSKPRFDAQNDAFITVSSDEDEVWQAETATLLGGRTIKVYPIGAGSWCWEEVAS